MTSPTTMPTVNISITVIMLFQVSSLFVRELVRLNLVQSGTPPYAAHNQSALAGFTVLAVLLWPCLQRNRSFVTNQLRQPKSWTRLALASFAIGVTAYLASSGVAVFMASSPANRIPGDWVPVESGFQWQCPDAGYLLLALVALGLVTPIVEEIINRGFFLGALVQENSRFPVLVSASLFTVLHRPDAMFAAFMFGLLVAVQMLHCRTLWGPVIAHATFNCLVVFDVYCFSNPGIEIALLALPPVQLALLGGCITIAAFSLALCIARWRGVDAH